MTTKISRNVKYIQHSKSERYENTRRNYNINKQQLTSNQVEETFSSKTQKTIISLINITKTK